ncbi:hypothetical protein [Spiroplasma endosymbiont of Asaphidion curtum]|uniref:hypothetical protein n=1 Tax=Spiroplasma endosymbiont of Asaphidion curtum TaxID=3066281 RepID=UPI00313B8075
MVPHNPAQKVGKHEIEINVKQESRNKRRTVTRSEIEVVLNSSNLYLDGFITTENLKVPLNPNRNREGKSSEYETNIIDFLHYLFIKQNSYKIYLK